MMMMMMTSEKKTKGVGIMPSNDTMRTFDGQLMPDRYYAILKYGHLGIYATLEEAIEAKRIADKEE